LKPEWKEGHDPSSYFWIRPVTLSVDPATGTSKCIRSNDQISIEEDIIHEYLYKQFLEKHFDPTIDCSCRYNKYDNVRFEFWDHNLYTYETVAKITEEMKDLANGVNFELNLKEFYTSLSDRLTIMMNRNPEWPYIDFEGP